MSIIIQNVYTFSEILDFELCTPAGALETPLDHPRALWNIRNHTHTGQLRLGLRETTPVAAGARGGGEDG